MAQQNLEMDDILERITFYCLDEAKKKLEAGEECTPFTAVVADDQMYLENYPGDDVMRCRADAEANVKSSSTFSTHYAFCYDGFLMTDDGQIDSLIVECATRDMEKAYVIGVIYKNEDGKLEFADTPALLDQTESFYDRAAVNAAKELERIKAGDDRDMDAAQEMLKHNLGGAEEGAEDDEKEAQG